MTTKEIVKKNLDAFQKASGLTTYRICKLSKVAQSVLINFRAGRVDISNASLEKLATVFRRHLWEFYKE